MGYDTYFEGRFALDRPLTPEHKSILDELQEEEHPAGTVGKPNNRCIYCQWQATDDGTGIEWDGGEKFRCWREWLAHIIDRYLIPWGYFLNGEVRWRGEGDLDWEGKRIPDAGVIYVRDNEMEIVPDQNPGPSWNRKYVPV